MKAQRRIIGLVMVLSSFIVAAAASAVHVSVKNSLGSGKNMTLHCQSKDTDLGMQDVSDGNEFGWDFSPNIWGTTLFFCQLVQGSLQGYAFDAYSYGRDSVRCASECLWLVAAEGMYTKNGQTGLWEYVYSWPTSS